jgi:hypothetical protein
LEAILNVVAARADLAGRVAVQLALAAVESAAAELTERMA